MVFHLSKSRYGRRSNKFGTYEKNPTPALCTPEGLNRITEEPGVDVVRSPENSSLRQIKTPRGLVDIIFTNSTFQYYVHCYATNAIGNGGNKNASGYYETNGVPPIRSYIVSNPNGATNSYALRLVELGSNITNQYDYLPEGQEPASWQLAKGKGTALGEASISDRRRHSHGDRDAP